jgi:hypothetical protein
MNTTPPTPRWSCPSAEEWARSLGIHYRIWSSAELPQTLARNYEFLDAFVDEDPDAIPAETVAAIGELVTRDPGVRLATLLLLPELAKSADPLWILIAHNRALWVDLRRDPLADPEHTRAFPDALVGAAFALTRPRMIRPGEAIRRVVFPAGGLLEWDGRRYRVINPGDTLVSLVGADDPTRSVEAPRVTLEQAVVDGRAALVDAPADPALDEERLRLAAWFGHASQEQRLELVRKVESIRTWRAHHVITGAARSTFFQWLKCFEEAEARFGNGAYGLIPKPRSGNTDSRLGEAVDAQIADIIAETFETTIAPSKEYVIGVVTERLKGAAPSAAAIARRIDARGGHRQDVARRGRKGAYGSEPYADEVPDATPVHGDFPFHVLHVDATELDVLLLSARTGQLLGRPTCMVAIDAFAWRVRGYAVRLEKPSQAMELELHERTAQRWRRLGQTYVVDEGSENHGTDVEMFLSAMGASTKWRPASKARYGTPVEEMFNILNKRVLHNLPGNTKAMKDVRSVSPESGPETHAALTLAELIAILDEYFFEVYDTMAQLRLEGRSPRDAEARAGWTGDRQARIIDPADPLFRALVCPTVDRRYRTVDPIRGVKVDYHYYRHRVFETAPFAGKNRKKVWVRQDPRDIRVVWAYANGEWVQAVCPEFRRIRAVSRDEIAVISEEIRASDRLFNAGRVNRARKIAEFIGRRLGGDEVRQAQEIADATRRPEATAGTTVPDGGMREPVAGPMVTHDDLPEGGPDEEGPGAPVPAPSVAPSGGWSGTVPEIDESDNWSEYVVGDVG